MQCIGCTIQINPKRRMQLFANWNQVKKSQCLCFTPKKDKSVVSKCLSTFHALPKTKNKSQGSKLKHSKQKFQCKLSTQTVEKKC